MPVGLLLVWRDAPDAFILAGWVVGIGLVVTAWWQQRLAFSCPHCGKNVKLGYSICHHCGRSAV